MTDRLSRHWDILQGAMAAVVTAIVAYFDGSSSFLLALVIAFGLNIVAGMRADNVRLKIERIYPPKFFQNFNGNKLKDSLFELLLITSIIYAFKAIGDNMHMSDTDTYIVKYLIWVATYYYAENALDNLSSVYPKNKFLRILSAILSFKFKDFMGPELREEIEKIEKEEKDG